MLNDLEVLNGSMDKSFESDIYEYHVTVDKDCLSLVMNFDVQDADIIIYGNDYLVGNENHVYVEVSKEDSVTTYTLIVNKEVSEDVINYEEEKVVPKVNSDYISPVIYGTTFLLIISLFIIIFKRK